MGTSFGITTAYLATGNKNAKVYTLEGSEQIAAIAKKNFSELGLNNIDLIEGNFEQTLPALFSKTGTIDFAFIDGNHRRTAVLEYFSMLLNSSNGSTILVFDDIHWSREMEEAWKDICQHPAVTLTIDLFFIGLVFVNPCIKAKQHFRIRF